MSDYSCHYCGRYLAPTGADPQYCSVWCSQQPQRDQFAISRDVHLTPEFPCVEATLDILLRFDPRVAPGATQFTEEQLNEWAVLVQQQIWDFLESLIAHTTPFGEIRGYGCGPVSMVAAPIPEP